MSSLADLSEGATLQQHVKTAKALTNETALINCIKNVLSSQDCYVFGELLALDSIKGLASKDGPGKQHYQLLELFAYGKYSDYKANPQQYPQLTDKQVKKLKQLSIVALANESHVIPYNKLRTELDIDNLRELGDVIIDALYKNIIVGKLDHEKQELQVEAAIGRDIRPQDIDKMLGILDRWEKQSEVLMTSIEQRISTAQEVHQRGAQHKQEHEKKLEELKNLVKKHMEAEPAGGAMDEYLMSEHAMHSLLQEKPGQRGNREKTKGRPGPRGRHMM